MLTSESGDALGKKIGAAIENGIDKHKSIGASGIKDAKDLRQSKIYK